MRYLYGVSYFLAPTYTLDLKSAIAGSVTQCGSKTNSDRQERVYFYFCVFGDNSLERE